ncbi:hypothetical protein AB835_01580 [Candidatus Endobugula sertula]|uniref:Uncharacterized protein n=1 Tax=Candidatus Endobugula sertula TaxID=62101 RepID=A0A1D2QT89_9GAMM|nr:hypothetical protein AB835_01580 [Candidatus Endobugula sertula]
MTTSEIFFYPGILLTNLLLSIFEFAPSDVDPALHWVLSLIMSLLVWNTVFNAAVAMIKKAAGFGSNQGHY